MVYGVVYANIISTSKAAVFISFNNNKTIGGRRLIFTFNTA